MNLTKTSTQLFLLLFIFLNCNFAFTQSYNYKHYNIFDGLVQNQVTSLYQDHSGFIWVGTKAGASRFDGIIFKNHTINDGLVSGFVEGFSEDVEKNLYCITNSGYSVFKNGKFQKLYVFKNPGKRDLWGPIIQNNKNSFIQLSGDLLYKYYDNNYTTYKKHGLFCEINNYFTNNDNREFISTDSGLFELKKNGILDKLTILKTDSIYFLQNKNLILSQDLFTSSSGSLIRLFYYNRKWDFNHDQNDVMVARDGNFWAIFNSIGTELASDTNKNFVAITSAIEDGDGSLWIGAETGLFHLQSYAFRNYEKNSDFDYIWTILEAPDSSIILATFKGKIFCLKDNVLKKITGFENLLKNSNTCFYMGGTRTRKGHLLIPTDNGDILDYYKGKFKCDIHKDICKDIELSLFIYEDTSRNIICLATTNGLYTYNSATHEIKNFQTNKLNVLSIGKDKFNRLWVCSSRKIFLFNGSEFIPFRKNEIVPQGGAVCCEKDSKGNMWIGNGGGLYVYSYQGITKLFDSPFFFIKLYREKFIIAGTISGFYYIDLDKFYSGNKSFYKFFDRFNGFTGTECGQNGTCIDSKGNIWIPTSDKVVKFSPDRLSENKKEPVNYIYYVAVAGKDLHWTEVLNEYNFSDTLIRFSHNKNNIRINYQGLSLSCPEKVVYKTRLLGYEEKWSEISGNKTSVYTNLNPGKYTFEVMSCNADGYWTKTSTKLTFEIIPAFWQTWWFKVLIFILLLCAVFLYVKRRERKLKRDKLILENKVLMATQQIREEKEKLEEANITITKEKNRSNELLLNILPVDVAEELKENGYAEAKLFQVVTVMFTDFKGFTAFSEKLSPHDLVKNIDKCYKEFDRITEKYGVEKIKTIGDSYMCAGGLPKEKPSNAEDTVMAALEIRDYMISEKQKKEAEGKTFFEIRIGIHSGPVVAGIVGVKKFAYDIWGDTVNIASRMESSSETDKVNISGSTFELIKEKFVCTYRGKIEAKNKGLIDMYFVEK